jgi:hypothetical protein
VGRQFESFVLRREQLGRDRLAQDAEHGQTYYFAHKVPWSNCQFVITYFGSPAYNSWHNYKLECPNCSGSGWWNSYVDGAYTGYRVYTGWQSGYGGRVTAGGEVGASGLGMQGGMYNMQYLVSGYWLTFEFPEYVLCDYGYHIIYAGAYNDVYDWGYDPPTSPNCASQRPG